MMISCGPFQDSSLSEDEDFTVSLELCTSSEFCFQCDQTISPGTILVREAIEETLGQYHLKCYVPISCIRYSLPTVTVSISSSLNMTSWRAIEVHNAHFTARFNVVPRKCLEFPRTRPVRALLEVFKYLDPLHDVAGVAGVNSIWYEVSWMEELWLSYSNGFSQTKVEFIKSWVTYCKQCRKQLTAESVQVICPLTKRPICSDCASTDDYTVCYVSVKRSKIPCIKNRGGFVLTFKKFIK